MGTYEIISVIILLTTIFAYINERLIKWPATIGIMALSLISSILLASFGHLIPGLSSKAKDLVNSIDFEHVLMKIMLSFMLFAGAIHVDYQKLKKEALPVLLLATLSTFISTFLVSLMTYMLFKWFGHPIPFIYCMLFGALISPTDPIAVLGILKKAKIPDSLEIKIAGESLFNDGVAVVLFLTLAESAENGLQHVSIVKISLLFLREAVGGIAFGAFAGYLGFLFLRSIDNYRIEVLITLSLVMGGYALADFLHVSAPIAMVVIGIMLGSNKVVQTFSTTSRDYLSKFWNLIDEIFNSVLFLLIGFQMLIIPVEFSILFIGGLLILVVLLARWISVLFPVLLLSFRIKFEKHAVLILTWGGLRGGISVALALSLSPGMHREELVLCTYIIVIFSIIVQGLTIGKISNNLYNKCKDQDENNNNGVLALS